MPYRVGYGLPVGLPKCRGCRTIFRDRNKPRVMADCLFYPPFSSPYLFLSLFARFLLCGTFILGKFRFVLMWIVLEKELFLIEQEATRIFLRYFSFTLSVR
jgi:hypothetical protein